MPDSSTPTYTARNRRPPHLREDAEGLVTRFVADIKAAPAPPPAVPPRPFGDLGGASIGEIVTIARHAWPGQTPSSQEKRSRGLRHVLGHLVRIKGTTWQQRWENSGLDELGVPLSEQLYGDDPHNRFNVVSGLRALFCMRVIRPSLGGFRSNKFLSYPEVFRAVQDDPDLDKFFAAVDARTDVARPHLVRAQFDVCCALTTQGIALADLTPQALLHYSYECRRLGVTPGANKDHTRFAALLAWQVLHETGHFPPSTPPSLRAFIYGGQKSVEELVDRYTLRSTGVRQLIIDYLTLRKQQSDYSSLEGLSRALARNFWQKIEQINPGQQTLALDSTTYEQWREALNFRADGQPRKDPHATLMAVRAFYVDLHSWAIEDPAKWGPWVATCPIPYGELRGFGARKRRVKERVDNRTRLRQPLLPALVAHVEQHYEQARDLLAAGAPREIGEEFTFRGRRYRRFVHDRRNDDGQVRLTDLDTDEYTNASAQEDLAFWRWAAIEVLRLAGIRIEELVELTHLSIRQYRRPNGEVVALLVIAPSKSDRERVIPMSAELFHVIAQVVRRHTSDGRAVPLLHRYDDHERTWTEALPYLFQRQLGSIRNVVASGTVLTWLRSICEELGGFNKAFADLHFTPHDFRRLFATEVANSGLPIHIGAALLGHLNLETFRGYVTVFNEDLVSHYQAFLERRRQTRPTDEYRDATPEEWAEFQEHFDKRKVELGGCARPYGTPCSHEHACIRCPQLNINPKMLPRLDEIEADLLERKARAEAEKWLGELEGIDLTLTYLRQKREQTHRLVKVTEGNPGLLRLEPPPKRVEAK